MRSCEWFIDIPRQISETLIFWLKCVDTLWGMGLRLVILLFLVAIGGIFRWCVDLTAETHSGYRLCGELPTDWVKSD